MNPALFHRFPARLAAILGAAALTLLALVPAPAGAAVTCDRVAAAGGSDSAAGTAAAPFATPQRLVSSLSVGQTGCVRGRLAGDAWIRTDGATLTSEPGQRGTIRGEVVIDHDVENATISNLNLEKGDFEYPTPVILGDDATLANNDITSQGRGICVLLGAKGHHSGARADRTLIVGNRIHNCGTSNNHQHGMYLEHAADTRIVGNFIYDNADRAIQLYPDADRTTITGNVIDGNGEGIIFSGTGEWASSDNVVRGNVITNSKLRAAVESWWGGVVGTGNLVEKNCLWGGAGQIDLSGGGFTARDNAIVDPLYVDRAAKDFRLREGSPCAALLEAGRAEAALYPSVPTSGTTPTPTAPAPDPEPVPEPVVTEPIVSEPVVTEPVVTEPVVTEPVVTAPVKKPKPENNGKKPTARAASSRPVQVSVRRRGARRARVKVRLAQGVEGTVQTLLEVRIAGRGWQAVAAPRLSAGRTFVKTLRLPRGAGRIVVRTSVVEESAPVEARL